MAEDDAVTPQEDEMAKEDPQGKSPHARAGVPEGTTVEEIDDFLAGHVPRDEDETDEDYALRKEAIMGSLRKAREIISGEAS